MTAAWWSGNCSEKLSGAAGTRSARIGALHALSCRAKREVVGKQPFSLKQRIYALLIAGLGGTTAAAVSFAMSVYEAANPDPIPVLSANETVDTGRWLVTIRDARIGDIPPTGTKPFEPKRFLMVEMDLDNRSAGTSNAFQELVAIAEPAVEGLPRPTYYLARDRWIAGGINPNMSERVIATWEWPRDKPLPSEVRLTVAGQIYKPRDNLYGSPGWFRNGTAAVVVMPVGRKEPLL
ncbi:hypothetical protein [Chelativorans sp.]|uniref:hypothetical protein n=1 Tax=Chelativorans sp. TaxID=2203393 RepID=UPI002810E8FF|nr:hypothetical protein [Chelativorans sp.]